MFERKIKKIQTFHKNNDLIRFDIILKNLQIKIQLQK
jgi:hypothetical protein